MISWMRLLIGLSLMVVTDGRAMAQIFPPTFYSAKEIRANLVDKDTGQPLEGVIVVAQWILFVSLLGHGDHGPRLHVTEAVTDAEGKFYIPAWGPKPNPQYPRTTYLYNRDPTLSFFKPGYRPRSVANRWERNEALRFSEWDGKTIELEKFKGTKKEWVRKISSLQNNLGWRPGPTGTEWRRMPRMILAIVEEMKRIPRPHLILSGPESLGTNAEEIRRFVEEQK